VTRYDPLDPFWQLILANYTPAELAAYVKMADTLEQLERERDWHGWSRKA